MPFSTNRFAALTLALGLGFSVVALESSSAAARAIVDQGYADLVEKVAPAVVNISTKQLPKKSKDDQGASPQFPPGSPFEDLFRDFLDRQGRGPSRPVMSLGSGFVIDASGLVVTNNHVIQDADQITVTLTDGTEMPAEVVGKDQQTDIALLRVKPAKPLTTVQWGDSEKARVGDPVIAVGNPLGLSGSVTAGIISARDRSNISGGSYDDFIQTDAAINRGNSGGPLFNLNGEVIGINSAIFSTEGGGSIGIGFSIPSQIARRVIDDLKQYGEARRGYIGVKVNGVDKDMAEAIGLDKAKGALVQEVTEKAPASKSGIQPGDVILKFDGKDIPESRSLPRVVADTPIGKKVTVEVWRSGQVKSLSLEVARYPAPETKTASVTEKSEKGDGSAELTALGLKVAPLTASLRQRYKLEDTVKGLVVTEVDPEKQAAERLRPGDVILEAGSKEVTTVAQISERIRETKKESKKAIVLRVQGPNGPPRFVALSLKDSTAK